MFYNIKICYNAEKRMKYTICVQNMCRMSAEFVQNKEIRYGIRIYKKGVKLIAATLSRHVASPWIYNNDSSRPGRYIMPRKHQGTIIPVMNINRYYLVYY